MEIIPITLLEEVEFFNCSSHFMPLLSFQMYLVFCVPWCYCILYSISYTGCFTPNFCMLFCGKTLHIREKISFVLERYNEAISWRIYCTAKYRECYVT